MNKRISKVVSASLCAVMLVGTMPVSAFATSFDTNVTGDYYNVISKHEYTLAPGATETEIVLNNNQGTRRQIAHVMEVDTKNPTIKVLPGYYGIDKLDPDNLSDSTHWKAAGVTETVKYYENELNYNVVGGMNTALAYDSNAPYDFMVYNGVVLADPANHTGNAQTYLAIKENGDCELRTRTEALEEDDYNVIAANFGWLVKDGQLVTKTPERTTSPASRSMIGIKADGTLVFCQADGRVSPTAVGLSNYEMGEMMLALGCVNAVNGDGGGSSTFVTRREGEETHTMRSIPSDGAERPTINSVIVVSTAKPSGVFHHSVINSEYDFVVPNSTYTFTAQGIDDAGYEMDIPADVEWALSDASFGKIEDGKFASNGKTGAVDVQMVYNNAVVASKTVNVVKPDTFGFESDSTVIPYGKKIDLIVQATYGSDDADVYLGDQYLLEISDDTAATLEGNVLTATTDESVKGVVVSATYLPDPSVRSELTVTFGKGSEIIYDFEDGDVSDWMGFDEAKQYSIDNGINNTLIGTAPLAGQYSDEADSDTFLATKENGGQVRNGEYALAWRADYTNAAFAGWTYNVLFNVGGPTVLRDVANGKNATKLGMWLYIPEGATGLAFQSQLYAKNADGTLTCKQAHFTFKTKSGIVKNLNSATEADIPESRWVYASIDLTAYDFICMPDPADTSNSRSPSVIRTYVKPISPAIYTFYIDDITLDYSSAVDDRELPTITNVNYIPSDEAIALNEDAEIAENTMSFSATVADNAGLDNSTGKIYIDGVAVESATVTGKFLSCENVTLTNGVHTIIFEIKDRLGNPAKVTRTFKVGSDALITLGGHNDSNAPAEYDSVYYVDINTTDINAIDGLTTTINLQTANKWEAEGMIVADGYEATAEVNEINNNVTVTVKKVKDTALTGAQTIVSIPVRVWSWDAINHITGEPIDREVQYKTGNNPIVTIDYKVLSSTVSFADGAYDGYFATFGGKNSVATNLNDSETKWHYHDTELTVMNCDATCVTDGYKDRTYCESCASVINWGTVVKATGHTYKVAGNKIVCDCGEQSNATGFVELNDKYYYAINGNLISGWQLVDEDYYYFDTQDYAAVDGKAKIDGYNYVFENNILVEGQIVKYENGLVYFWAGKPRTPGWFTIKGKTYLALANKVLATGRTSFQVTTNSPTNICDFDENGVLLNDKLNGVIEYNGKKYFVKDSVVQYGAYEFEGDTYYFRSNGVAATGKYNVAANKTNNILKAGYYVFDESGKLIKDGWSTAWDGIERHIVNGKPDYTLGAVVVNGDTYYVYSEGKKATGKYYVEADKTNGILEEGYYLFDENGALIKDGWSTAWDGKERHIVNGKPDGALGVIVVNGDTFYIRSNGVKATGKYYVAADKTNDILEAGYHLFDENGALIKDGWSTAWDGKERHIVNGKPDYTLGVIVVNGDIFYIRSNGQKATGKYYVAADKTNGILESGYHVFDENGALIKDGWSTAWDGKERHIVNGKPDYTLGVITVNGDIYYIRSNGQKATGRYFVAVDKTNGLLESKYYNFGTDGKLIA